MKVLIEEFNSEQTREFRKTVLVESFANLWIDGKLYEDALFGVSTGQVTDAFVEHEDLSVKLKNKLRYWYHEANFGDVTYQTGKEFTL